MISLLKNRKFAIFLSITVAFFAMLFGVSKTLSSRSVAVEKLFFDGVYIDAERYQQPSIDSQLDRIITSSLNLVTLLQSHDGFESETQAVTVARRNLINAQSISEKHNAFIELRDTLSVLSRKAENSNSLSEREQSAIISHTQTLDGASSYITNTLAPTYNSKVDEFRGQQSIISKVLGTVSGSANTLYFG